MVALYRTVQWLSIEDVANEFCDRNKRLRIGLVMRELQRGWYKWSQEKQGVKGFACGTPLKAHPPEAELPSINTEVSRDFIARFAQEQGWAIPLSLAIDIPTHDRRGRPTKRMPEIMAEYERRAKIGKLEKTVRETAEVLRAWAKAKFRNSEIASVSTIANNISATRQAKSG